MSSAFHFSRKERRALVWIVLIILLMRISFIFGTEAQIYTQLTEDSFYLFSCAEHLAQGHGFTVDGKHPTNGVQPLIVAVYAPLFTIADFDKELVLRMSFGLAALFDALSAILLALLVRSVMRTASYVYTNSVWRSPHIVAAALWGLLYPVYRNTVVGLETGLYSLCLIGSLYMYAEIHRLRRSGELPPMKRWVALGFVLGITVLARIDAVMLVAAICIVEVYRFREKGIGHAFVLGLIAVIVSSPWWLYNYFMFGNFMPQSGMAESIADELQRNCWVAATVIADSASVFFFLPQALEIARIISAAWIIIVFVGLWLINRRTGFIQMLRSRVHFFPIAPLILLSVGFIVFYVFFFSAPHFITRYFQPIRLLGVLLGAVALPYIYEQVKERRSGKLLFYSFLLMAWVFSFARLGYLFIREPENDFYLAGRWARTVPEAKIGMDQSGTAGFISPNVVNLDGKVNFEALQAKVAGGIGVYVAKEKFDYIADWKEFADVITTSAKKYGLTYSPVDSIGRIHIYKRVP
jgi:hypothetical protein